MRIKKSEAGILHVPLFPDSLLFRAHRIGATRTLKLSASEGAVSYYMMFEVTQRKPESKGKVIGPY